MRLFEISDDDNARINTWLKEVVYPEIIAEQKDSGSFYMNVTAHACWEDGYPYTGAIGGGVTYSFSPTSLGIVTKVTAFNRELDLTEYGDW